MRRAQKRFEMEDEDAQEFYPHPVTGEPIYAKKVISYKALETIKKFHACKDPVRALVGPVGSGKTAGACMEIGYRIPMYLWNRYGLSMTRWLVLRNTYPMLVDSTQRTFFQWFPPSIFGTYNKNERLFDISYTTLDSRNEPITLNIEVLFRSCDRSDDIDKFRGYELTGYYIDESDEVPTEIKNMLKQRIGRFPAWGMWLPRLRKRFPVLRKMHPDEIRKEVADNPDTYQIAFGIETSNPPSTESALYHTFEWKTYVPGPKSEQKPLKGHAGFWQPPRENESNLQPGYYERLAESWQNAKDWIDRYIEGMPGIRIKGKVVYNNFSRRIHEALAKLVWSGGLLYRGWDNTGLHPACVIVQSPTPRQIQILREHWTERENIVTFAKRVIDYCNKEFPNAEWIDYADPAGWAKFSTRAGTLTSNSELMMEEIEGLELEPSEQNFQARVNSVDQQLMEMVAGGEPALLVDPDCVGIINGFMGGYSYPRISTSAKGEEIYSDHPIKNRYSDLHDALQYIVVKIRSASPKSGLRRHSFGRPADPLIAS